MELGILGNLEILEWLDGGIKLDLIIQDIRFLKHLWIQKNILKIIQNVMYSFHLKKFTLMIVIKCPKCGANVEINIAKAVDELGEVHMCPKCKYQFRYVDK